MLTSFVRSREQRCPDGYLTFAYISMVIRMYGDAENRETILDDQIGPNLITCVLDLNVWLCHLREQAEIFFPPTGNRKM